MAVKILIVDDERDLELLMRRKFRQQIASNEFEFVFAHDGHEALKKVEENPDIEVILTDLNMPEMDGLTLLGHLKKAGRFHKTVVVSAYGDMNNIRTAMNRGAFDFLTKPIDFNDVEFTIRKTIQEVQNLKEAAKTRQQLTAVQCELDVAARIQNALLPKKFINPGSEMGIEIYATMVAARTVGGDFYDFFRVDSDRVGFLIGDVAGKGVPASLFMTATRALMRATAIQQLSPGECLLRVNRLLCRENVPAMFVTMIYGILDSRSGELEFSVAGHGMPYLLSRQREVSVIAGETGPVLGILDQATFPTETLRLSAGDGILLCTDGATEAMNIAGEEFTSEQVQRSLQDLCDSPVQDIVLQLLKKVEHYSAGAPQSDDITVLALRYLGPAAAQYQELKKAS